LPTGPMYRYRNALKFSGAICCAYEIASGAVARRKNIAATCRIDFLAFMVVTSLIDV
jgi:hypothetical protein